MTAFETAFSRNAYRGRPVLFYLLFTINVVGITIVQCQFRPFTFAQIKFLPSHSCYCIDLIEIIRFESILEICEFRRRATTFMRVVFIYRDGISEFRF